jgi:hypothetical protein
MTRGPEVGIRTVGADIHLTQNGVTTVKQPGVYVVGRHATPGVCPDRYDLVPQPDITATISRKHAVLAFRADRWWLEGHPDRPTATDLARERSTWLRLEPGQEYPLPIGARDGRVGLYSDAAPILLEVSVPIDYMGIKVTSAISGEPLCALSVKTGGVGKDIIDDVAARLRMHPTEMKLLYGATQIFEDLPLRQVFGGAVETEYDVALVRVEKRGFMELLDKVRDNGPRALHYVDDEEKTFLSERRFAGMAVSIDGHALAYMAPELFKDRSLLESAIRNKPSAITHVPAVLVDRELSLFAVSRDPSVFVYVLPKFQNDPELLAAYDARRPK